MTVKDISFEYLKTHPNHILVFGDNTKRYGTGGMAKFRNCPNTYGFITKKVPNMEDESFYKPEEYSLVYKKEMKKLQKYILDNQDKTFLISPIGSNLANKYGIWEEVIRPNIFKDIDGLNVKNVVMLFERVETIIQLEDWEMI